jgi:hypothetical protein
MTRAAMAAAMNKSNEFIVKRLFDSDSKRLFEIVRSDASDVSRLFSLNSLTRACKKL